MAQKSRSHFIYPAQEKMLMNGLESIEVMARSIEELHQAWKFGSEGLLLKFSHEPLKKIPNLFQKLIIERNVAWLPNIMKLINENKSTLVAVGTAHLFGESNIIDSLISAGYNIERLA